MSKDDLLKVVVGITLLVLVLSSLGIENETLSVVSSVLTVLALIGAIAVGAERGTELLKMVLRFAFGNVGFLKFLQPTGAGSALLAFLVSYAGVTGFDVNIFGEFEAFKQVDSQLVSLITVALTWIGSGVLHKALPTDVGKAQAVK